MQVQLKVNGKAVSVDVAPNTLLVTAIRENLKLTGTHVGCDTAQCGACTVLLNGHAVKACNVLALQAAGCEISTIEGLSPPDGSLHVMQQAFKDCHGLQCGFCTPGMVMCRRPGAEPRLRERGRHPQRAGRQFLPLHRLPEHRARRPAGRRTNERLRGQAHESHRSIRQAP